MRPPRIAAEYVVGADTMVLQAESFNEAAANRGGIQQVPQHYRRSPDGFNEAAANRGGIRRVGGVEASTGGGFNEAAANRGGIPDVSGED